MKRLKFRLYFLFTCIIVAIQSHAAKVITGNTTPDNTMHIDKYLCQDTILMPFNDIENVYGITVDATIIQHPENNHLVRILLQDDIGKTYLIAESYKEIYDADTIVFRNYGMESSTLNAVSPTSIKFIIKNASVKIENVKITTTNNSNMRSISGYSQEERDSIRYKQVEAIAKSINEYNQNNNKWWWAGVTPLSLKGYDERKRILGITDSTETGGLEYYQGGIFEIGEPVATSTVSRSISPYIDNFDWRDRHGKNWITPAKDQGNSPYCTSFTVASVAEAMINLYYNRLINLDLSEQNIAVCASPRPNPYSGGLSYQRALNYLRDYGTCDEETYPFVDEPDPICMSDEITPQQHVTFSSYNLVGETADDNIKQALIQKGPLVSGFTIYPAITPYDLNHAMTLVGYKVIQAGDSICQIFKYDANNNYYRLMDQHVVNENDYRIGMTCWIFKDNYPKSRTLEGGYMYLLFHNPVQMNETYSLSYPFTIMNYTDNDIVCEDADGDGFYFWGLGNRPASCPSWVANTPDGDDSNADYGPMNEYGFLESLQPDNRDTIFVTSNKTESNYGYKYNHICINSGATLNVTNTMIMHNGATITVRDGGSLIIDGGMLDNASVNLLPGSSFVVKNNGSVKLASGNDLNIPLGVNAEIPYGCITPK